jgi:hypothetical protein
MVGNRMMGLAASLEDRRLRVPRFFRSITIILATLYPNITPGREQTDRSPLGWNRAW